MHFLFVSCSVQFCSIWLYLYRVILLGSLFPFKILEISQLPSEETLAEAERLWVLDCQSLLTSDPKYRLWKLQFGLFFDDNGLIRCRGRLENADLPHDTRLPIRLESGHPVCRLIVIDCHERVKHNGATVRAPFRIQTNN